MRPVDSQSPARSRPLPALGVASWACGRRVQRWRREFADSATVRRAAAGQRSRQPGLPSAASTRLGRRHRPRCVRQRRQGTDRGRFRPCSRTASRSRSRPSRSRRSPERAPAAAPTLDAAGRLEARSATTLQRAAGARPRTPRAGPMPLRPTFAGRRLMVLLSTSARCSPKTCSARSTRR